MRAIPEREYNAYIHSAAWAATKRLFLAWCRKQGRHCCWFCGDTTESNFQIHHIRYDHFGNEPLEDLSLVCNRCHKIHNGLRASMSFSPAVRVKPSEWLAIGRGLRLELTVLIREFVLAVIKSPPKRKRRKIGTV